MSHQYRVYVFRLDTHGAQIVGEHSEGRAHTDPATRVDQHPPACDLHQESVHRHLWRNGSEGGFLEPLTFQMVDPDDEIERGLERPVIHSSYVAVADRDMVEPVGLASRQSVQFKHQEKPDFPPDHERPAETAGQRSTMTRSRKRVRPKSLSGILGPRIDTTESLVGTASSQMTRQLGRARRHFAFGPAKTSTSPIAACPSPLKVILSPNVNVRSQALESFNAVPMA